DRRRVPRVADPRRRPSWGKPPRPHLGRDVASGGALAGWGRVALRRRRIRQLFPRAPRLPVAEVVPERPQVARAPAPPRHPRGGRGQGCLKSTRSCTIMGVSKSKGKVDGEKVRAVVMLAIAMALVGVAYGALAVGAGLPVWVAPLLGVVVLAGSSEMLYVGLATATSPWLALPASLLVNVRHVPYGMAVRPYLGRGVTRLWRSHVMNDESVAFALAERDPVRAERSYSLAGISVLIGWPIGALAGSLLGRGIDQEAFGLDAIFPAVILALVIPALKRARLR